ncbi:MAG: DMT family transporter [Bacteroidota bacterium]|nr:DMT family transporter [Bacteroidota bacterium]
MSNQAKGIIYTLITVLMWGVLAIALKVASKEIDSPTIVWFRFSLAFSALFVWMAVRNPQELKILYKPTWLIVISSLALAWNYLGFMLGIQFTSPSNAQIVIQTGPVLLAVFGIIFFREKISRIQTVGFLLSILGFWIFYGQHISTTTGQEGQFTKGVLLTLTGAVAWAVYAALQKKLVLQYSVGTLNVFIFGLPVLLYLPFVDFANLSHLRFGYWALLVFLGANTLISYGCLSLALKYLEAGKVSIIIVLNPIITVVLMGILTWMQVSWIDGEHFSVLSIAGALLALAGAILVVRKTKKPVEQ